MTLIGKRIVRFALYLAIAFVTCQGSFAQRGASSTADIAASINVFAGGSYVKPAYGFSHQKGYVFGADFTRYFHRFYVEPSIEVRALISPTGEADGEHVYSGGLKVEHAYGRYHPYADILLGAGTIKFVQPAYAISDNSIVYTYGGGVDIDLVRGFGFKAEFQGSHWDTGGGRTPTPTSLNFAVVYRIPFPPRR